MTPEQDAEYNRLFSIVAAQEAAGQQEAALRSSSSPSSGGAPAAQTDSRPRDNKGKEKVDRRLPDRATFPQNDVYDEDHAADMQALLLYEAEEEERERRRRSLSSSEKRRRRSPEPSSSSSSSIPPDHDIGSDSTTATATTSHTEGQQQKKEVALHHASRLRPRKKPRLSRKNISVLVDALLSLAADEENDSDPPDDGGVSFFPFSPSPSFGLLTSFSPPPFHIILIEDDEIDGNHRSS
ncbi:MAG: hypothetical protein KIY12_10085 [Thermoplasmata archaeon]|uniref:Uncharacterized protein n=1 Tax=Candidatus Sysuiplasma superficiale TaxID=2823368 RepID=A0A8J7YTL7_9ARCH|nr:hypothetical protein [Candidatus Sysuiplasma superficiale]